VNLRNRKVLFLSLAVAILCAAILGVAVHFLQPREPVYQGKTLSAWIAPFCVRTLRGFDAPAGPAHLEELQPIRRAVAAIGTNALPLLIEWVNRPEPRVHYKLRQLSQKQPFVGLRLTDPTIVRIRAVRALAILGKDAQPAIPALAAQLTNGPVCAHAVYALEAAGLEGLRALANQMTNADRGVRIQVALALMQYAAMRPGIGDSSKTNPAVAAVLVPGLIAVAQDSTSPFRFGAIQQLGALGPAASDAVPPLLQMVDEVDDKSLVMRPMAINALTRIGAKPEIVIPVLTNHLQDPNGAIRMAARNALHVFGYDAPPLSPDDLVGRHAFLRLPPTNAFQPGVPLPPPPLRISPAQPRNPAGN
jgi:hypothetical protein